MKQYVHLVTGNPWTMPIPSPVRLSYAARGPKGMILFEEELVSEGDDGYEAVLQAWMYRQGYVPAEMMTDMEGA